MAAPPPNKPTYMETPFLVIVRRVDPDFDRARQRHLEYDFSPDGRRFYGNPNYRGPYGNPFSTAFDLPFGSSNTGGSSQRDDEVYE